MTARTNGNVRFGTLLCFAGGLVVNSGFETISENLWAGIVGILLGAIVNGVGINKVQYGIKEILRVNDLENKRR